MVLVKNTSLKWLLYGKINILVLSINLTVVGHNLIFYVIIKNNRKLLMKLTATLRNQNTSSLVYTNLQPNYQKHQYKTSKIKSYFRFQFFWGREGSRSNFYSTVVKQRIISSATPHSPLVVTDVMRHYSHYDYLKFNRRQMISIEPAMTPQNFNSLLLLLLPLPQNFRNVNFNAFIILS